MSEIFYIKVDMAEAEKYMEWFMKDLHERCRKLPPMRNPPAWLRSRRPTPGSQGTGDKIPETQDP